MRRIGVIILGASVYDHHPDFCNSRFENSAREFRKLFADRRVIAEGASKFLYLYDKNHSPSETTKRISEFLDAAFEYVVIYYCGHGDLPRKGYRVFLRGSQRDLRGTLLDVPQLIEDLQKKLARRKVFIIVDACYSGDVIKRLNQTMDGGSIDAAIEQNLFRALPQMGMAILTATDGDDVALAEDADNTLTLFTGKLVEAVRRGVPALSEQKTLSWSDVKDYVAVVTREKLGPEAPTPKIWTPSERHGDVTRVPFFINRAYLPPKNAAAAAAPPPLVPYVDEKMSEHLYWSSIPATAGIEVYDDYLRQFPTGTFAALAQAKIRGLVQAMGREELDHFLQESPLSYGAPLAEAHLVKLARAEKTQPPLLDPDTATPIAPAAPIEPLGQNDQEQPKQPQAAQDAGKSSQRATSAGDLGHARTDADESAHRNSEPAPRADFRALVVSLPGFLLSLAVTAVLVGLVYFFTQPDRAERQRQAERDRETQIALFRTDLQGISNDADRLRPFIARCRAASSNCTVLADAEAKLAQAEREADRQTQIARFRTELQGLGNDADKLRPFIARCRAASSNCMVLADAEAKLAQAEREADRQTQIARFRTELQALGNDVDKLRAFVARCRAASSNCTVLADAEAKLAQAEREADRQTQIARFRTELQGLGNDVDKLRGFVVRCRAASSNCTVLTDAEAKLAQAEREIDRQTQIARVRTELQGLGNDVDKLRAFIVRCRAAAANCTVLADAERQLARAESELDAAFSRYAGRDLHIGSAKPVDTITSVASSDACEALCRSNKDCKGFSLDKWNKRCYLKAQADFVSFLSDPRTDSGVRKSVKEPVASSRSAAYCIFRESTLEGSTIKTVASVADWEACKDRCNGETNCIAFTLSSNSCRLLSSTTERFRQQVGDSGIKSQNEACVR